MNPRRAPDARGFSLMELMVILLIVAVLATLALPNYQRFMVQAHRGEAKTVLLDAAHQLERTLTASASYMPNNAAIDLVALGLSTSPKNAVSNGAVPKYALTFHAISTSQFTLKASPQAPFVDADCGELTFTDAGVKNATGPLGGAACWGQ